MNIEQVPDPDHFVAIQLVNELMHAPTSSPLWRDELQRTRRAVLVLSVAYLAGCMQAMAEELHDMQDIAGSGPSGAESIEAILDRYFS